MGPEMRSNPLLRPQQLRGGIWWALVGASQGYVSGTRRARNTHTPRTCAPPEGPLMATIVSAVAPVTRKDLAQYRADVHAVLTSKRYKVLDVTLVWDAEMVTSYGRGRVSVAACAEDLINEVSEAVLAQARMTRKARMAEAV